MGRRSRAPNPPTGVWQNGSVGVRLARPRANQRVKYEEYHPHGTTAWWAANSSIDALRKRYRYTGKEKDEETGFSCHHRRYYADAVDTPRGAVDASTSRG